MKVQTGLRVDKFVFDGFKELRGFVRAVEMDRRYVTVRDGKTRVDRTIYRPAYETAVAVLSKVRDEELIREAEKVLEKANKAAEKIIEG